LSPEQFEEAHRQADRVSTNDKDLAAAIACAAGNALLATF
jgi:hypothetical protein